MFLSSSSRIIFLIYVLCTLSLVSAESLQDVNKWLCADENCSDPIAISTAKKLYTPDDTQKISVNKGDKVQVLRKPADPSQKYYYVKSLVSNRKGLISKDFIREIEILHPDKTLIEVRLDTKSTNSKKPNINPSPPTTVYDGTTITDSYADNFHSYEPTQSQAHPNDAGSPSLVQSTTPPSVTNEDAPTVVDSVEVENRNAYEHESTYPSKEPSIIPNSSIIPDSALDGQMLSDDDKGISSTPASTIINEPSLLHDVPKAADTVQPTTEITVGPDPIPIHKSQAQENFGAEGMIGVEDVNGTSSDLQLDPPKEGETLFESATSKIISYLPFGNGDDTAESESEEKHKEADDKVVADREAMPSSSIIEKDLESMMAVGQDAPSDESVNTEKPVSDLETSTPTTNEADVELKASDLLEDLSEHVNDDHLASNLSSSSGPVDIADKDVPVTPTRDPPQSDNLSPVGSNMSDSQSTPSQSVDTEEQISFEDAAKPFDQENIHPPEQNIIKAESDEPLTERSPSSVEPKDAQLSQNNHVEDEPLPTKPQIHEVPAVEPDKTIENATDSEKSYSNMKFGSTDSQGNSDDNVKSEVPTENSIKDSVNATIEHSESPSQIVNSFESQKVVDEPTPLGSGSIFRSSLDFVDPRSSNPEISTISSNEQVPAVTEERITEPEPTNIVVTANIDEPIQEVDENMTLPTSEPSYQTRVELPETTVSAQIETSPSEPPSLAEEDSSDTWYSSLMSSFGRIQEMVSGRGPDPEVIPSGDITPEVTPKFQVDEKAETCTTEACDHQYRNNQGIEQDIHYQIENLVSLSPRGLIVMVITTIAILLFSLGYYYLENLKRDVELVSKYNDLAGKLFIEQKEKEMLAEQLASVNESMTQISFDTTKYDGEIAELKILVQKYKEEKCTLEEKEKETRKKFMMVEKNYNELRNILSQNKQKGERSALILDIKNLKESIAGNNIEIASLKEQLLEKKEEIKSLNTRIVELKEANKQLEGNVEKAISENHDAAQKYQDNIAKLEKTIEESTFSRVKLEKECAQLKKEKESLAIEKELAETSLQKFQRLKPSNSLTEWLDVKEVRVSLLAAEKKIEELTAIRDVLTREKTLMEDRERTLVVDLDQLNDKYEKAEKDKIEALTKLQVLSDYFKEKETQLQEELGTKESLWLQKQSDDRTIYEQMRALREENTSFKNQNETLKREILDQEASFKKLITSAEEKAHENWVALRHHERRLKEAQMEAAQLRSRLTALEATSDNSDDKMNKGEVNGDIPPFGSATSPPFMLYPEFVPPPPLLPNTPSRPPPLGRISSPPLGDFTPPPPLVPYEMFLPPSPPPPAPHVLHKPQPMDGSHRIQKDSQSSNHSSESVPDRPRRNKR